MSPAHSLSSSSSQLRRLKLDVTRGPADAGATASAVPNADPLATMRSSSAVSESTVGDDAGHAGAGSAG